MELSQLSSQIKNRSEGLATVVAACRALLWNSPQASEHLKYIRGRLTDSEIWENDIGFFPPNNQIKLLFDYVPDNLLYQLDIIYDYQVWDRGCVHQIHKSILHYHNLVFPLTDEYGNIITLAGRTILGKESQKELGIPKYKNFSFKKQLHLFGLNKAKKAIESRDQAVLVEGQIDLIKCHSHGLPNTIALTGSDLSVTQAFFIKRRTNNLCLLLDNDQAGQKAAAKIKKNYSKFFNIQEINLPEAYGDVDSFLTHTSLPVNWSSLLTSTSGVSHG